MSKINLLQVIPYFTLAGAEIMCENLVRQLVNDAHYNVIVVTLFDRPTVVTERLRKDGIRIICLNKKSGFDITIIPKLVRVMRDNHIDIMHTHLTVMSYAVLAAIIAGVPRRIHTVHNTAKMELGSRKRMRMLARFFYKYCHVIPVSISPQITKSIAEEYALLEEEIPMVFNGTNLEMCQVKSGYETNGVFRFVHVGRFSEQKNHKTILEAAALLKRRGVKFEINLVGGGELEVGCKRMVQEQALEDCVRFCGLQSNVYPFLHNADAFMLPSVYEGMPISIIEAMGTGLPIIASRVGGIPDMIQDAESGLLIEPTAEALADAMLYMMNNSQQRECLGRNALVTSARFSTENMYNGYKRIYESE